MVWCNKQRGGGSDYAQMFYFNNASRGSVATSRATMGIINQTPMFNPLQPNTIIPRPTGIIPTGTYLAAGGGGTIAQLRDICNANGISCRDQNGKYLSRAKIIALLK